MSTAKVVTVVHPSATVNNIVNDASGNVTVGNDLYVPTGNVGIGTTSPSTYGKLAVNGIDDASLFGLSSTSGVLRARAYSTATSGPVIEGTNAAQSAYANLFFNGLNLLFGTGNTERARIDSSGNLLVGATSALNGTTIQNAGGGQMSLRNSTTTAGRYYSVGVDSSSSFIIYNEGGTGVYISYGGVAWIANSDERLKEIIEPIADGLKKVNTLRAIIGAYKSDKEKTRRPFLIAQDVQAVLPEAVDASNPDKLGLAYSEVIPLLVASIQELSAKNDALEARLAKLENTQ